MFPQSLIHTPCPQAISSRNVCISDYSLWSYKRCWKEIRVSNPRWPVANPQRRDCATPSAFSTSELNTSWASEQIRFHSHVRLDLYALSDSGQTNRSRPRQLWRKMREWGLYVYHVRDRSVTAVGRHRPAVLYSIPDPTIGIGGRPGRYYSWSLDLPDYHKHRLWSLCIFPISRTHHSSPRPSSIHAVEAWAMEGTDVVNDYRQHLPRIFEYSCCVHKMLNVWTEEVLDLSRANSLMHSLQEWLSCPLADLQALTWMFWVILDLALRSSITVNSEGIPTKHTEHHEETVMHLKAAGALLDIANRKAQTDEQKGNFQVLANALESSQRTFSQKYFQLSITTTSNAELWLRICLRF